MQPLSPGKFEIIYQILNMKSLKPSHFTSRYFIYRDTKTNERRYMYKNNHCNSILENLNPYKCRDIAKQILT